MSTAHDVGLPSQDPSPRSLAVPLTGVVSLDAPLGVQSDLQLVIDDEGAVIGVFVPQAPTMNLGTRVMSRLTLGVISTSVEGVVAWTGEGGGPRVRRRRGLGITFPSLTAEQRALLDRGRLLHEGTRVPSAPAANLALVSDGDAPDYELRVDLPDCGLSVDE